MKYDQRVNLSFEYPVCFTADSLNSSNPSLVEALSRRENDRRHRIFAVVESRVAELWPNLERDLERYCSDHAHKLELLGLRVAQGGEICKTESCAHELLTEFDRRGLDRQSVVLALGGGAFLDMAGYATAIAHRGLRLLRMPTTVLGQNDSGIGVKNGVNAFGKKNFLGVFAPPFAVINDFDFLRTLPRRDAVAGMAEAVKVALIKDPEFFSWLCDHAAALAELESKALSALITRCARLHLQHIAGSGDPFELGSARPLDFGHWAAHKLESLSRYELRHGEAVGIGIALDTYYSAHVGLLPMPDAERAIGLLEELGFTLWSEFLEQRDHAGERLVWRGLEEFREHLGGTLTVTLLQGLGRGVEVHSISRAGVEAALEWLSARAKQRASRLSAAH